MSGNGRYRLALGLAFGTSLAFLAFLLARPVGDDGVKLVANVAQRELPFPSLADFGYLTAIPLAAAAMLAFPGRAERAVLQVRSLLDGP